MLVRRRPTSLNPSNRIRRKMVRTTTTTTNTTIMGRKESILIVSKLTVTKEHEITMEIIGRVM